jgi:AhpD family alkylhydroperoxidase
MTYQQQSDLILLPRARQLARAEFDAFMAFHESVFRDGGAIPLKYRELIALAVGSAMKCGYCIDTHTRGAAAAGADGTELAEAVFVAAAVGAGSVAAHSLLALRLRDEAATGKAATGEDVTERAAESAR